MSTLIRIRLNFALAITLRMMTVCYPSMYDK